jgi:hypothetical protein
LRGRTEGKKREERLNKSVRVTQIKYEGHKGSEGREEYARTRERNGVLGLK